MKAAILLTLLASVAVVVSIRGEARRSVYNNYLHGSRKAPHYSKVVWPTWFAMEQAGGMEFSYDNQDAWSDLPGSQCGWFYQSPINIRTSETETAGKDYTSLEFKKYHISTNGKFKNLGKTVEFVPNTKSATLTNKFGKYTLQQFHMHWGRNDREGSEHRVNGKQYAAEIHFVHLKEGAANSDTNIDTYSVVSVLCKAADIPVRGVWKKLRPVPTDFEEENSVKSLYYEDLLPKSLDYYHYEGSLTTPPCHEEVEWFVLKEPIDIPKAFLRDLRKVEENKRGSRLAKNFRNVQETNHRIVTEFNGGDDYDERGYSKERSYSEESSYSEERSESRSRSDSGSDSS